MQTVSNLESEPICENCGSKSFVVRGGFRWCTKCGLGVTILDYSGRVPGVGAETHYAPENRLCFGKNLGNPGVNSRSDKKALFRVLGKKSKKDLGIRAIQVKNECMRAQETPVTQRIKSYLSDWCKQFGWGENVLLSNSLGNNAKWVGTILTMMNDGSHSKDLAKGIFVLNVYKFFGRDKALEVEQKLKPKMLHVQNARNLISLVKIVM